MISSTLGVPKPPLQCILGSRRQPKLHEIAKFLYAFTGTMANLSTLYDSSPTLGKCSPPIGFTHWKTKENNIMNLNIYGSKAAFFLLPMYSQNSILKGNFVKIMFFWNFQ
jgi:hypothetical protein